MTFAADHDARSLGWPLRLDGAQVRHLLSEFGVTVDEASPIRRLVDFPVENQTAARHGDPPMTANTELVARGLWILAAPRQLIAMRLTKDHGPVVQLAHDGELIARFDVGTDGCMLSTPVTHTEFADAVSDLIGAPATATARPALVGRHFLQALTALLKSGLASHADARISRDEAQAALTLGGLDPGRVPKALEALAEDGVVKIDESGVQLDADWLADHRDLITEPVLEIVAFETADVRAGRSTPSSITVLSGPDRRLALLPGGEEPAVACDTLLHLIPSSRGILGDALASLLRPPSMPPAQPVAAYVGSPVTWLEGLGGDRVVDIEAPGWNSATFEELTLTAAGSDRVAAALLHPGATIEIAAGQNGRADAQHNVLAMTGDDAAEWTRDGSRIRWRTLDAQQLSARLLALLPPHPGSDLDPQEHVIGASALAAMSTGRAADPAPSGDLSAPPHSALADPATRWFAVRALWSPGDRISGASMLLASSPDFGLWRLEPHGAEYHVTNITLGDVIDELAGSFAAASG